MSRKSELFKFYTSLLKLSLYEYKLINSYVLDNGDIFKAILFNLFPVQFY